MSSVRVSLNEEDFRALVRGEVVEKQTPLANVEIALGDIGFGLMLQALETAMSVAATGPVCECSHPRTVHQEVWGLGAVEKYRCTHCACADYKEAPPE